LQKKTRTEEKDYENREYGNDCSKTTQPHNIDSQPSHSGHAKLTAANSLLQNRTAIDERLSFDKEMRFYLRI